MLGLDGATFDVIRPLAAAGLLPNLARWMRTGLARPLASTTPPVTFPAWSSFLTGLDPGEHGIFDFTQKVAGAYRVRFTNASHRRGASFFHTVSTAGGRVLALGMPATYPPEPLDGLLVSGFDAPVSVGTDPRSASAPALYTEIASKVGPWMRPDLDESATGEGFHERAVETLLSRIERKTAFALEALSTLQRAQNGQRPDLFALVFSESDTVGHHYFRDFDASSPRHDPKASAARMQAIASVYRKLDAACGELREAFGEDALCVVVSDHGMGAAGRHIVHPNARLRECGLYTPNKFAATGNDLGTLARGARGLALRALSPRAAQALFRRARPAAARLESAARFGGMDAAHTRAFSEEANTQPGVWINLRGREAAGCVAPADYERVREEVISALLDWKLPGGEAVVARAQRREAVYRGRFVDRAPDVVFELALEQGYGISIVPTPGHVAVPSSVRRISEDEFEGGRGRGMNGTHRPEGILIADGPGASAAFGDLAAPGLADFAPQLLGAMGLSAPNRSLDGASDPPMAPQDYDALEDARVAARLRALGYLE